MFKLKIPSSTNRTREIMKNCVSYELNVLKIKKSYNSLLNWVHNIQLLCFIYAMFTMVITKTS